MDMESSARAAAGAGAGAAGSAFFWQPAKARTAPPNTKAAQTKMARRLEGGVKGVFQF
jgi:hypothetical protein